MRRVLKLHQLHRREFYSSYGTVVNHEYDGADVLYGTCVSYQTCIELEVHDGDDSDHCYHCNQRFPLSKEPFLQTVFIQS